MKTGKSFKKCGATEKFIISWIKIKKNKNGITPLHIAVLKGHLKTCELIVACNVQDKNPADNDGITPLCCAVRKNHLKICELLLEK